MTELDFLKNKGLIEEGFTKFTIKGDFGEIELTELLKEYKAEQLILSVVVEPFGCGNCGSIDIDKQAETCGNCEEYLEY